MSGLKNTVKRVGSLVSGQGYSTSGERKKVRDIIERAENDKKYSSVDLPDEEKLRIRARREKAKNPGSRVANILTDGL